MEAESTLVRAQGRVELDTEAAIDLDLAFVVFPGNSELDDSLWDSSDLESLLVLRLLLKEGAVLECGSKFCEDISILNAPR